MGHTKMDIRLLEVSGLYNVRIDDKICCEDHTCQGESGSEFKRSIHVLHHAVTTHSEMYWPTQKTEVKCVDVSAVHYMDVSATGMYPIWALA